MPYENLLLDTWSKDNAIAEEDAAFLANLIFGYLISHFSDRNTFSGWPKNCLLRIENILKCTARYKRKVAPSCALRALVIVLSLKDDPGLAHTISSSFIAEVLWIVAFMALAADRGQRFTMGEYTLAMRPRDGVNREYFESIFHHTPRIIRPYLKQALAVRRRLSDRRKVEVIMEYWLAPWMAKVDRAMGLVGIHAGGPAMRTHSVYFPRAVSRSDQLVEILPVRLREYCSFRSET